MLDDIYSYRFLMQILWPTDEIADLERRFATQQTPSEQQAIAHDVSQAISDLTSRLQAFRGDPEF